MINTCGGKVLIFLFSSVLLVPSAFAEDKEFTNLFVRILNCDGEQYAKLRKQLCATKGATELLDEIITKSIPENWYAKTLARAYKTRIKHPELEDLIIEQIDMDYVSGEARLQREMIRKYYFDATLDGPDIRSTKIFRYVPVRDIGGLLLKSLHGKYEDSALISLLRERLLKNWSTSKWENCVKKYTCDRLKSANSKRYSESESQIDSLLKCSSYAITYEAEMWRLISLFTLSLAHDKENLRPFIHVALKTDSARARQYAVIGISTLRFNLYNHVLKYLELDNTIWSTRKIFSIEEYTLINQTLLLIIQTDPSIKVRCDAVEALRYGKCSESTVIQLKRIMELTPEGDLRKEMRKTYKHLSLKKKQMNEAAQEDVPE